MRTANEIEQLFRDLYPNAHFIKSGDWHVVYLEPEDGLFPVKLTEKEISSFRGMGFEMHESWIASGGHIPECVRYTYTLKQVDPK